MGKQLAALDDAAKTAAAVAKLKPKTDGAPAAPMDTDDDHNQKLQDLRRTHHRKQLAH